MKPNCLVKLRSFLFEISLKSRKYGIRQLLNEEELNNWAQTPIKSSATNNIAAHAHIYCLTATLAAKNQPLQVTESCFATYPSERMHQAIDSPWGRERDARVALRP